MHGLCIADLSARSNAGEVLPEAGYRIAAGRDNFIRNASKPGKAKRRTQLAKFSRQRLCRAYREK